MALDLANLSQPGVSASGPMPTPVQPDAPPEAVSPAMAPPSVGGPGDTGIDPTKAPPPPPGSSAGGHARLLSMIQGLSIGLSNFGKAGSTGGREGGASGVIADTAAIQEQKIKAQAAAQAQKNAALQQQLMQGQISEQTGRNHLLLATTSDQI